MIPVVASEIVHVSPEPRHNTKVSVVTPAYNPGRDLDVAVSALNEQNLRDFEWVLVDDCSNEEGRRAIARAIQRARFPVTVLRHRVRARQGQARNTGVCHAAGRFVKFLDADDGLDPSHLETLLAAGTKRISKKVVVFAPTRHLFLARGKMIDNRSYLGLECSRDAQLSRLLTAPFLTHGGALFPRALIEVLGGYDPSLVTDEDGDLLIRVLLAGWRFEAVPSVFYIYRHHEKAGRVSRDDSSEKIAARVEVGERVVAHFAARGEPIPDCVIGALCRRLDALAVRNWRSRPQEARALLIAARALRHNHPWSGSMVERAIRRFAGIGFAHKVISTLRAVKGVSFH